MQVRGVKLPEPAIQIPTFLFSLLKHYQPKTFKLFDIFNVCMLFSIAIFNSSYAIGICFLGLAV